MTSTAQFSGLLSEYARGRKTLPQEYTTDAIVESKKGAIGEYARDKQIEIKTWSGATRAAAVAEYAKGRQAKIEDMRAYGQKVKAPVSEKSEVEVIADVVQGPGTATEKAKRIVTYIASKNPTETKEGVLARAYAAIWSNTKPLLFYATASVMLAVAIALFQVYFAAGSWFAFLTILKNLGVKVAPAIALKALRAAGISLGTDLTLNALLGLAERNKVVARVLNKQMKPEILIHSLKKMGIDLSTTDLSMKSLMRQGISSGITLGTGDIGTYVISASITAGTKVAGVGLKKAKQGIVDAVKQLETIPDQVVERVLTDSRPKTMTDALHMTKEVERTTLQRQPQIAISGTTQPEEAKSVREMIVENRSMAIGTTAAIAVITLALTTDVGAFTDLLTERVASLGQSIDVSAIASRGANFIEENYAARTALFGMISNKIGLQKVIDVFVDKLTPNQVGRMKVLEHKIRGAKVSEKHTLLNDFFALLLGEKIYDPKELESLSDQRLKEVARSKNIRFERGTSRNALIDAIRRDQANRLNNMTSLFAGYVSSTVKMTLTSATMEYAYQNLPYASASLDDITKQLEATTTAAQQEVTALDSPGETVAETAEMRAAQELEEGLNIREAAEIAGREAAEVERLTRREIAKQQSRLAQMNAEKARLEQLEITKRVAEQHEALRRLREAATATELAKQMSITIVGPEGTAHPIPADELLLDERMQKVLEEIEFTPFLQYLTKEVAKSSTSWIPGLGYIESVLNTANWSLDVAEKLKDIYKVLNVAIQLTDEKGESKIDIGEKIKQLDELLKKRVSTISGALDDLIKTEKVNMKKVTLEALRDKILYGWDNSRVALEIGKKVVVGKEALNYADSTLRQIGEMIWSRSG